MHALILDGPAVEPVTLAEMRAHLRLDGTEEDEFVSSLVAAARVAVEGAARLLLMERDCRLVLSRWAAGRTVTIPLAPVSAVSAVRLIDAAGQAASLDRLLYRLDAGHEPPLLLVDRDAPSPDASGCIEIDFTGGFGPVPEAVPPSLRLAIKLLAARWFSNRGDAPDPSGAMLPADVRALLAPHLRPRLR